MPYSLVSAATLGFDLVRLPAGRAVAEVLLVGLAADASDLTRIATAHPARGLEREQRGVRAVRSRRAREMAASVPHVRDAAAGDAGRRATDVRDAGRHLAGTAGADDAHAALLAGQAPCGVRSGDGGERPGVGAQRGQEDLGDGPPSREPHQVEAERRGTDQGVGHGDHLQGGSHHADRPARGALFRRLRPSPLRRRARG